MECIMAFAQEEGRTVLGALEEKRERAKRIVKRP